MITLAALDVLSPEAVLVGALRMDREPRSLRPKLTVRIWDPTCRRHHDLPWPLEVPHPVSTVVSIEFTEGPLAGRDVLVGLDPDRAVEHKATIRHFAERLRSWRREAELAGMLVEPPRYSAASMEMVPAWT